MEQGLGEKKGKKLIMAIKANKIKVDKRPNHGREFYGAYEQLHKERFHNYLGSSSRYLGNKRIKEQKYHG